MRRPERLTTSEPRDRCSEPHQESRLGHALEAIALPHRGPPVQPQAPARGQRDGLVQPVRQDQQAHGPQALNNAQERSSSLPAAAARSVGAHELLCLRGTPTERGSAQVASASTGAPLTPAGRSWTYRPSGTARVRLFDSGNNRKRAMPTKRNAVAVRTAGLRVMSDDAELEALRMLADRREEPAAVARDRP